MQLWIQIHIIVSGTFKDWHHILFLWDREHSRNCQLESWFNSNCHKIVFKQSKIFWEDPAIGSHPFPWVLARSDKQTGISTVPWCFKSHFKVFYSQVNMQLWVQGETPLQAQGVQHQSPISLLLLWSLRIPAQQMITQQERQNSSCEIPRQPCDVEVLFWPTFGTWTKTLTTQRSTSEPGHSCSLLCCEKRTF